jgi:hydrogenase maturation protease
MSASTTQAKTAMMNSTLILGVGNPLMGDDALGILAVQELRTLQLPGVDVIDGGTEGLGLIPLMESYRRVILVDAVPMGQPAGTIRRFTWDEIKLSRHTRAFSLHQSDLSDALILAETLNCLPPEVVIYSVQPQNTGWDDPVSAAVERTLPVLLESLLEEVRSIDYDLQNFSD